MGIAQGTAKQVDSLVQPASDQPVTGLSSVRATVHGDQLGEKAPSPLDTRNVRNCRVGCAFLSGREIGNRHTQDFVVGVRLQPSRVSVAGSVAGHV